MTEEEVGKSREKDKEKGMKRTEVERREGIKWIRGR